jgi:hypothetical protein
VDTLGQLPLRFERNEGQFDANTRFAARGLRYGLTLRATDAVIDLRGAHGDAAAALRMSLVGAREASAITGLDQQPGVVNQLHGRDPQAWQTNIATFGRVRYANVYDRVDLVYHGNDRQLEYDFEIAPGGDPRSIRLRFDGARRLERDASTGDLLVHVADGTEPLRQHAPVAYQRIKGIDEPIESRYVLDADGSVRFEVGAYDRTAPLTIDPVILYSSLFGGGSLEDVFDITLDPSGNIYITGRLQGPQGFPTTPGALSTSIKGPSDAFVSKFNPAGSTLIYSTYLGGSSDENYRGFHGAHIAADAAGNAYVAGDTNSPDFPVTSGAYDTTYADNVGHPSDVFYVKLGPTGTLLYGTYIGGTAFESNGGIAVDSTGNVYVAGITNSTNATFPMAANAYRANNAGDNDLFLIKFDPTGARLYSTYFGGVGSENNGLEPPGLAIDDAGNAYLGGDTDTLTNFPLLNGFQNTIAGLTDAFVAKIDTTKSGAASLIYSTLLGGTAAEQAYALAYAGNGVVVIGGNAGAGFPVKNALDASFNGGGYDCFLAKIDTTQTGANSLLWATYVGGNDNEFLYDLAIDPAGNIHFVGNTRSTNFPQVSPVGTNVFLYQPYAAEVNGAGTTLMFASYFGGTSNGQSANGVATNPRGDTFLAGTTNNSRTNPPDAFGTPLVTPYQSTFGGESDVVIARIGNPLPPNDTDEDGLPNDWETKFGLDPNDPNGDNGPNGDPDHDGYTNAQELAMGTHPRGFVITYLAEGATGSFFSTRLALANPTDTKSLTLITFQRADAVTIPVYVQIAPHARYTLDVETVPGLESADFSTLVEADVQIVADRTMTWDHSSYGSHAERGILTRTATTWYLAEGSTTGSFSLFYLVQNPGRSQLNLEISYLLPAPQPPIVLNYVVPPTSRLTIPVNNEPGLKSIDVSAILRATNNVPFVAERSMYFSRPDQPFAAGHESAGVTETSTHWFLAEGATGSFFNMFILLANPNTTDANVELDFLMSDGSVIKKTHLLPAQSRVTLNAALEDPLLQSATFSTVANSTNGVGILVERSMWWPANNPGGWYEAHNSPGETTTGTKWAMAEGETGGSLNKQTYILIANTSTIPGTARLTLLYEDGTTATTDVGLPASGRVTVNVGATIPASNGRRYGAVVETLGTTPAQVVVERAMYSDANGVVWAAGTDALATKLQ